jgi:polysaccharide deacetylase 2 family uncharacterized protein YibQ
LAIAWVLVLGVTAAAAGFVVLKLTGDLTRTGVGITIVLPPVEAPPPEAETVDQPAPASEETPEQAGAEKQDEPPEQEAAAPAAAVQGPRRVAVVITGLGLSKAATEQAVDRLPAEISLSFSPYAEQLDEWIARARGKGHEVLIDLPMEPVTFPEEDPGPQGLLTTLEPARNLERLNWILERGQGYIGVAAVLGSRFTASEAALLPVLETLKDKGVMFVDNNTTESSVAGRLAKRIALPHAVNDRALDGPEPTREAVDARLVQIERLALARGFSIAMGESHPVTLDRLANWAISLEARGFDLTPISELAVTGPAP